jgi:hypothetical protein
MRAQTKLAEQMSLMDFHAMLYDNITEALYEAGGLSDLWFGPYKSLFLDIFHNGLQNATQYRCVAVLFTGLVLPTIACCLFSSALLSSLALTHRYLLAFALVTDSFSRCATEYLPDEVRSGFVIGSFQDFFLFLPAL